MDMKFIESFSKKQFMWLCASFILLMVLVIITIAASEISLFWKIVIVLLTQAASCFFFPILIGQFIDREKSERDFGIINNFYQDFSEGGIIRIYKDREPSAREDNGENALKKAFEEHSQGEVKLVGVSLRVFFNQTGQFYNNIDALCKKSETNTTIKIKALISSENAPETINRGKIESPGATIPTIITEIGATKQHIARLNNLAKLNPIDVKEYIQAPYCTAVIFPDKCFISQNILCDTAPVKLPLIIFRSGSHGYDVINSYFEYLWKNAP